MPYSLRSIDLDAFRRDILNSDLIICPADNAVDLANQYNSVLSSILDKHAPLKSKRVSRTLAVLKIEDSSTAPGNMVFPRSPRILSANQRQISFQTASFSMKLSDWLALSHDTLCRRGCG